jgi:hypothetical protein
MIWATVRPLLPVVVRNSEVEHKVRVQDFERWLNSQGRTPAEMSLKKRLRELLGSEATNASLAGKSRTNSNRNNGRPKT